MDILNNLKALVVILVIATVVFSITKSLCLHFMTAEDLERRRNVWFALTILAFVSPSIWLYFFIAAPIMVWAGSKDSNPLALYVLLMYVIPPYTIEIPTALINNFFPLSNLRILAITILIPAAWRLSHLKQSPPGNKYGSFDFFILSFLILQLLLFIPYESITNTMRRGFLSAIDIFVLYYVVSRVTSNRRALVEVMAVYCLTCAIFSPLALFESLKTWLLYPGLADIWEVFSPRNYLFRGDVLRAQVSTGHALTLGGIITIGFGYWLYISKYASSSIRKVLGGIWIWIGLLAAYSRAPWISAAIIYITYRGLGPSRARQLFKTFFYASLAFGALLASPIGDRVIDNLPFLGTVDAENVVYRQRLAEKSWELVQYLAIHSL
jgi:hypothetical protein